MKDNRFPQIHQMAKVEVLHPDEVSSIKCSKIGCMTPAMGFCGLREVGRNGSGLTTSLALCPEHMKEIKAEAFISGGRTFEMLQKLLKMSGHFTSSIEDIEVVSVSFDSADAKGLLKRLK